MDPGPASSDPGQRASLSSVLFATTLLHHDSTVTVPCPCLHKYQLRVSKPQLLPAVVTPATPAGSMMAFPVLLETEGHLPVDAFVIVVAIKKLDLLKGLGAGIVAAEVRVHAQEQVEGGGAYERWEAAETTAQAPNNKTKAHSGPVFPIHWKHLGKSLPFWSLSSLMSIMKGPSSVDCKVYTHLYPITLPDHNLS